MMSDCCPVCKQAVLSTSGVAYIICSGSFHPVCVAMQPRDVEYMRDHLKTWQCPDCLKVGRKTRSQSVSKASASQSSSTGAAFSQDHITRLFSELAGIRSTQESIVVDLANIKLSQSNISSELNTRCRELQNTLSEVKSTIDAHGVEISDHTVAIDNVQTRLARVEADLIRISEGAGTSGGGDSSACVLDPKGDMDDLFAEFGKRLKRSRNLMIFGVEESTPPDGGTRKQEDRTFVTELFHCLDLTLHVDNVFRVGKRSGSVGNRPLKVVLCSESDVTAVIRKAGKLKGNDLYRNVGLSFDRTPRQISMYRALKEKLQARVKAGEGNLRIRYVSGTPQIVSLNR